MRSIAKIAVGTALGIVLVVALIVVGGSVALGGDDVTPAESLSSTAPTQTPPDTADVARSDAEDPDLFSANPDTDRQPTQKKREANTPAPTAALTPCDANIRVNQIRHASLGHTRQIDPALS